MVWRFKEVAIGPLMAGLRLFLSDYRRD